MVNNVLWTGGWDSTYRVLDLLIIKNKNVKPIYIIDEDRNSTKKEIETINKIIAEVEKEYPKAAAQLEPLIIAEKSTIKIDPIISKQMKALRGMSHLGTQYEWLASYAKQHGIKDLELGIHEDDKAHDFIKNDYREVAEEDDTYFEMNESLNNLNLGVFTYFRFPILKLTKSDMLEKSKRNGFIHLMEMTWFCHDPFIGKPCGVCNPCKYTKEEGLGRRVPSPSIPGKLARNVRLTGRKVKKKIKNLR